MARRKYRYSTLDVITRWAKNSDEWRWPSVGRWLSSVQKPRHRCHSLFLFCEWAGKNPDELLALKKNGSLEMEYLLDEFVGLDGSPDAPYTNSIMWNCVQAVRSFFKKNYLSLEPAAGKMVLRKVKPYRKHTKAQALEVYRACYDPRDQSLVCTVFCTAMARETLMELRWTHFEEDWMNEEIPHISIPSELLKGHGVGKWQGVRQETFLTPEAKRELLYYRDWMENIRGRKFREDDHVYLSVHEPYGKLKVSTLAAIHLRLSERLPFGFSWHDGRRYVQTALEEAGLSRSWIQKIKGRKVRGEDNPYSRPEIEKLREAFKRALPNLCFLDVESVVNKIEMDNVKLALGEQSLRERELSSRVERLEKGLAWLSDPSKASFARDAVEHYIAYLKKKQKGN